MKLPLLLLALALPTISAAETIADTQNSNATETHSPLAAPSAETKNDSQLGFYKPDDVLVPDAVKKASKSVVYIAVPGGDLTTVGAIFGEGNSIQDIIKKVESTPVSNQLLQQDKDIYLNQLRECAKTAKPLECRMYDGDQLSSGYLIGDGSRIRTAYHAISASIRNPLQIKSETVSTSVPVLVYDSSGKLLFSGSASAEFPRTYLQGRYEENGRITLPNDDLAELQLNKPIGSALPSSSSPIKEGEALYLIGFPKQTDDRAQFGKPDSPGGQLRVSVGKIISMEVSATKQRINPADLSTQTKSLYQQLVATDTDGAPGMSGGVAVNSLGQAVGTYTAGYPADGAATPNHVSYISKDSLLGAPFKQTSQR